MTKSATIRARMDPQLKEEVETILNELGISATQALTLFYQQIRLRRGIPFDVRLPDEKERDAPQIHRSRPFAPFPQNENRSIMERNWDAFKVMHPDLITDYLGQYVAICDGELVDHDPDPVSLLQRVRKNYPNQVVLRRKVDLLPERELHIRHPHIEQSS